MIEEPDRKEASDIHQKDQLIMYPILIIKGDWYLKMTGEKKKKKKQKRKEKEKRRVSHTI